MVRLLISSKKNAWRPFTLANMVTFLGFACAVIAAWKILHGNIEEAIPYYIGSAISDFLDGQIARNTDAFKDKGMFGWLWGISRLGKMIDPIRDKLLVCILALMYPVLWWAVGFEALSVLCSAYVRKKEGGHVIVDGSRVITAAQLLFGWSLFRSVQQGVLPSIIILSFLRFFLYARKAYAIFMGNEAFPQKKQSAEAA